ncbi:MAG: UbiX family flavin prenyltransferase [Hydrogenophaga sp.]|uniref:UbiX family flavin prenyltransferase n=1 Tax=Hydrogenophaga sp. TaxID=1904254 RepID=UPI0025BBD065|nr:UbiX family flavin prenyltransferase [Hydrogenophaga sp.]MBT9551372.1 UbiX family flavin prenyltransferase [Hydrogenophaga sp.]
MPGADPGQPTGCAGAGAAPRRLMVAITGASGAIYGLRLLQTLQTVPGVETHLVVSDAGWQTLRHELHAGPQTLRPLVHTLHDAADLGAGPASGSFRCAGMVVAPCSMRTLAAIAHGLSDNLVIRAADVMLKERRRLVLMARETPLHLGHLRNMTAVTEMGAIVCPPVPAFYLRPQTIDDIVNASVARVLDLLDVPHTLSARWAGLDAEPA